MFGSQSETLPMISNCFIRIGCRNRNRPGIPATAFFGKFIAAV